MNGHPEQRPERRMDLQGLAREFVDSLLEEFRPVCRSPADWILVCARIREGLTYGEIGRIVGRARSTIWARFRLLDERRKKHKEMVERRARLEALKAARELMKDEE